jgi:hypothetical protein
LGPASEVVGAEVIVIVTLSEEAVHGALAIVHLITTEAPAIPVKVEVGELVEVIVATPETTLHVPVPTIAVFPPKVVVVPQILKSAPALATVGAAVLIIVTSSVEEVQGAFAIVHRYL